MTAEFWILLAAWLLPCAALIALIQGRNWRRARQKLRAPVAEKLLRAPGENLRKKLEELEDRLSQELTTAFVMPLAYASLIFAQQHGQKPLFGSASIGFLAVVGVVGYGVICRRLLRLLDRRRNYRLGLGGERAVGEELNRLMLEGCHVFHDVPNDPYGNVDHVLVAPSGVYAVETKTRRKKEDVGAEAHKVVFHGNALQFPDKPPVSKSLKQAARLGDWLSKAVGAPVQAHAVLALPGWFVDRKGRGEVIVVSGKEVRSLIKGRAVLHSSLMGRIVYQLDQKCRDVEF